MTQQHVTQAAEMQKLLEEHLQGKLQADGTYHVTPELMQELVAMRVRLGTLEKEHREMARLLPRCLEKLRVMHGQTGGEYGGGAPLHQLAPEIEQVLSSLTLKP
jgi:hypothetical protein